MLRGLSAPPSLLSRERASSPLSRRPSRQHYRRRQRREASRQSWRAFPRNTSPSTRCSRPCRSSGRGCSHWGRSAWEHRKETSPSLCSSRSPSCPSACSPPAYSGNLCPPHVQLVGLINPHPPVDSHLHEGLVNDGGADLTHHIVSGDG